MRITISGKNIELTEGLKQAVEEKLSKLEKFLNRTQTYTLHSA